MERRIELPSGNWAVLRDPGTVTNRERKPIEKGFETGGAEGAAFTEQLSFVDKLIVLLVSKWSLATPIPSVNPESLEDIPALDVDKLRLAVMEPESRVFLDTSISMDPKAPSGDSGNGSTPLLQVLPSTEETPPTTSESTTSSSLE